MEAKRKRHGTSMETPWNSMQPHGNSMDLHGTSMETPRNFMQFPWKLHGTSMETL